MSTVPVEASIVAQGLTKSFAGIKAVDNLSFRVEPGSVTGFLGPNGAGKTTTLRMILGLAQPHSGTGTISGVSYVHLPAPGRLVGAVLEATSFHPGRSARNHLRIFCAASGLPDSRADEVLDLVGLASAARFKVGGFSLGMRQRLGLATALLGNPRVLLLDEPANGLDPEGIAWLRGLLRHFADQEGKTVLVSSHILSEVEQTVDRVVIIAKGNLIFEGRLADLAGESTGVIIRTPTPQDLAASLSHLNVKISVKPDNQVEVLGATPAAIGRAAWEGHVELNELRSIGNSLEETFLRLTADPEPQAITP